MTLAGGRSLSALAAARSRLRASSRLPALIVAIALSMLAYFVSSYLATSEPTKSLEVNWAVTRSAAPHRTKIRTVAIRNERRAPDMDGPRDEKGWTGSRQRTVFMVVALRQ